MLEESKDNVTSLLTTDHEVITGCLDGRVRRYDLRMGQLNTDCVGSKTASQAISVCICFFQPPVYALLVGNVVNKQNMNVVN